MKAKVASITAALLFIVMVACEKDSSGPQIIFKLKSLNGTSFKPGETVRFIFEFTPKTTKNDTLFVARKFFTCSGQDPDTLKQPFPEFDNNTKGELEYSFVYGSGGPFNGCVIPASKTDSLTYKFWIKDKDGNISDTITSPKIILLK